MPNLRGPNEKKRRLYASVIESMVLYGAPIWGQALLESELALKIIRNLQRPVVNRVCAAYRTVSRDAAMLLSRQLPYEMLASERARVYDRYRELRDTQDWSIEIARRIKADERVTTQQAWIRMYNRRDVAGIRTRDVLPNIEDWMTRGWGGLPSILPSF